MVHTGSRGIGEIITQFHLRKAHTDSPGSLRYLDANTGAGREYLNDMRWAVTYATESRIVIINRVADILERVNGMQIDESSFIDTPHNYARLERHYDRDFFVHRKSANSARENEVALIPGSMGTESRIVIGRGNSESLCSSSHGAGRTMSRKEAFGSITADNLRRMMEGVVFNDQRARHLCDESPRAYKDLSSVMKAQRDLVATMARLTPILNYKGL
jgi:tRNA-splicing ligase RtcB